MLKVNTFIATSDETTPILINENNIIKVVPLHSNTLNKQIIEIQFVNNKSILVNETMEQFLNRF